MENLKKLNKKKYFVTNILVNTKMPKPIHKTKFLILGFKFRALEIQEKLAASNPCLQIKYQS